MKSHSMNDWDSKPALKHRLHMSCVHVCERAFTHERPLSSANFSGPYVTEMLVICCDEALTTKAPKQAE